MSKKTYSPRLTKTVHGGLRPQGGARDAWWRKRWIAWLESLHLGARLGRGRNYTQLGQIRTLSIMPGEISAEVQGASPVPYHVCVKMNPLDVEKTMGLLCESPVFAAQLAAHTLPIAFEEALRRQGLLLFPETRKDMEFHCDCKDWARPCKHLAAALCLFADTIAADPQLLLRFRGIVLPEAPPVLKPQVLPEEHILRLHPSADATSIPRRLGALPYWRGTEDFRKSLETAYRRAHDRALSALEDFAADLRFPEDAPPEG